MARPIALFSERLHEAMELYGVKSVELCKRTGIPKSAMSQYIGGRITPRNDRLFLLAQALNVDEAWLLGYDVPMKANVVKAVETDLAELGIGTSFNITITDRTEVSLISAFREADDITKEMVLRILRIEGDIHE